MRIPDDSACWNGDWNSVDPRRVIWAQSAVLRTVRALPELHPWRLGDDKGSGGRTVAWCAASAGVDALGVLTQTAPPIEAEADDPDAVETYAEPLDLFLARSLPRDVADAVAALSASEPHTTAPNRYFEPGPGVQRWAGALGQVAGSWLPPLVILPHRSRGIDDPGTRWSTESLAFAQRHTVHAEDMRYAADVLAPHVIALILEQVPDDAAVTISGDAIHVWWEYNEQTRRASGKTRRCAELTDRLRDAIPSFVLDDYPDESQVVEDRLAERAAQAAAYRAARRAGQHRDPTLQRIYSQAQAEYRERGGRS